MERIEHWVVLMFENRPFDSLLGHLPHIDAADGLRDREIALPYAGGEVRVSADAVPHDRLPDPGEGWPGEQGFAFDRFGVRVPAIVVSPYTERGTVIADDFHTTLALRTLRERFDLGPALTARDAAAPSLEVALLLAKRKEAAAEHVCQIGEATLRNAARLLEHEGELPTTARAAREWLGQHAGPIFKDKRRQQ